MRWTGNPFVKNWGYESSALPYYARLSTRSEVFDETRPQNTGRNSGRVCFCLIRIVYSVDETARTIEIVNIDDRGDIYK